MPKPIPFELGDLVSVQKSAGFRNLLIEHKKTLQKQVNCLIREQRFTEAYGELCKLDDIDKIMGLLENRITELTPKKEG